VSRKALLIGAQTGGLSGVDFDVASMAEALARREFDVERYEGSAATRDGILGALEKLIAAADSQDAIFLYYSGHGGYLPRAAAATGPGAIDLQFIVPADYHESTEDDFRGISSIELSSLVKRLTTRTRNVVIAFDCCHAAHMSRDADLLARALPRPDFLPSGETLRAHVAALPGQIRAGWDPLGNPHAVRLVACAAWQSAYEYTNSERQRTGMLTESLVQALREFEGLPVGWSTLMERVRTRVANLVPNQRPEVEGPGGRRLFETVPAEAVGALAVTPLLGGRIRLDHAPLFGVQTGDEFLIMPPSAAGADETDAVATATIDKVTAVAAFAPVHLRPGRPDVPPGSRAHLTKAAAPTLPVWVDGAEPHLIAAIEGNPRLHMAADGELAAIGVHVGDDGGLTVHDHAGPLHDPRPAGSVAEVIDDLERIARATALRTLSGDGAFPLKQPITVEWGRVGAGGIEQLPPSGAVLNVGDRIYVRVRNDGKLPVYASLIDVGVAADITPLTTFDPGGIRLSPGEEYVLGADPYAGTLDGAELGWPPHLDAAQARQETIVVLLTSAPQDIGGLGQVGVRAVSPVDRFVAHARPATRDLITASGPATASMARVIAFDLVPSAPLPRDEATFQIDERPPIELRLMSRSARGAGPTRVAVQLDELVVHRNRSWGGTDIRLDALVITGHDDEHVAYRARTERFARIHDGERLPLDRLLMYHGPAVDFLDLAIWVSRDTAGGLALGDLLQQQLTSAEVQSAGAQLIGLAAGSAHAGVAMAAAGACVVLGNTAYRLLTAAVGRSVGLYRTSLLAGEAFGVGRHPSADLLRAQDFSFAFSVTPAA
jgi:hypothetical protein